MDCHLDTGGEAAAMRIVTPRITLREFEPADRAAFVGYQSDPRYRNLYDLDEEPARAGDLFDLFVSWQKEKPRLNYQLGLFETATARLCGCAGLRQRPDDRGTAVLGIELAPSDWGRYRIALDATMCLLEYGFDTLRLATIIGSTASGNKRAEKLARWFGARIVDRRDGPKWMQARGWQEVDWALARDEWWRSDRLGRPTTSPSGAAQSEASDRQGPTAR
jgi:ribosomal-protein-alanine N-acetyltransferase